MEKISKGYKRCECEHVAHGSESYPSYYKTPHGNPGHDFYAVFAETALVKVKTPFGIFRCCPDCASDCYTQFPRLD